MTSNRKRATEKTDTIPPSEDATETPDGWTQYVIKYLNKEKIEKIKWAFFCYFLITVFTIIFLAIMIRFSAQRYKVHSVITQMEVITNLTHIVEPFVQGFYYNDCRAIAIKTATGFHDLLIIQTDNLLRTVESSYNNNPELLNNTVSFINLAQQLMESLKPLMNQAKMPGLTPE
jgi:hypothetical protein